MLSQTKAGRFLGAGLLVVSLGMVGGCDFNSDFLFSEVEGIPAVYELTGPDGGPLVPVGLELGEAVSTIQQNTIYAELAPANTTEFGGATFTFQGTGGNVCIWVDPEVVSWNTAINRSPSEEARFWTYPDNVYDDADIDIIAGPSVFYTGSPGRIGDFQVAYEDSLGNDVQIELASCPSTESVFGFPAFAGRGVPEYCTINTAGAEGVSYTVVLRNFSTPLDDSRGAFGLLLTRGSCLDLFEAFTDETTEGGGLGGGSDVVDAIRAECLIKGEAIEPFPVDGDASDYAPFFGYDAVRDSVWARSENLEEAFCSNEADGTLETYCRNEANRIDQEELQCSWENFDAAEYNPDARCFCGDPNEIPDQVGF